MSFSSRRRNYLLTPHRRDGLVEWMKNMLSHSFVLDCLETTGADTFAHFEVLIDEHRRLVGEEGNNSGRPSRLKQLVPTVGTFHTRLPLRKAFELYNAKHRLTKRKHIQISFNELRHILNLAQIIAMRTVETDIPESVSRGWLFGSVRDSNVSGDAGTALVVGSSNRLPRDGTSSTASSTTTAALTCDDNENDNDDDDHFDDHKLNNGQDANDKEEVINTDRAGTNVNRDGSFSSSTSNNNFNNNEFNGPQMITFDGDQTLYSDGSNFDSNPALASYLCHLLRHGVIVAIVTAAGYEYNIEKYEFRLSGLLNYFKAKMLTAEECERFLLFGGECNYLLHLGSDYRLHPVKETGRGGWLTTTKFLADSPANWLEEDITALLDVAEAAVRDSVEDQQMRGMVIRKKRAIGLVPNSGQQMTREALDETVLRCQGELQMMNGGKGPQIPFCAFNGGRDVWVDVGNKRVGVEVLGAYMGVEANRVLHIGDQFLNTGNDYAARDICPCIWITSPEETTYVLKTILRFAGVDYVVGETEREEAKKILSGISFGKTSSNVDFGEVERRVKAVQMDVFTGEMK